MTQANHEKWNESHYPGTRQLCVLCDSPTEKCEEDSLYLPNGEGPVCVECYRAEVLHTPTNSSITGED